MGGIAIMDAEKGFVLPLLSFIFVTQVAKIAIDHKIVKLGCKHYTHLEDNNKFVSFGHLCTINE